MNKFTNCLMESEDFHKRKIYYYIPIATLQFFITYQRYHNDHCLLLRRLFNGTIFEKSDLVYGINKPQKCISTRLEYEGSMVYLKGKIELEKYLISNKEYKEIKAHIVRLHKFGWENYLCLKKMTK
ncbi:hypothetical protein [Ureibacillus xyleni]|nr:hypothetical protein [Ureibacillus xyleni]